MIELFWRLAAKIAARPAVSQFLYRHTTPYFDLYDVNDGGLYMERRWLFNGYLNRTHMASTGKDVRFPCLPSIRIHHIVRPDLARHPHNHPWPARSIILKGWYRERRDSGLFIRKAGQTATLGADEFHHIEAISPGGVWTLFITWQYVQGWGFRTPEGFVPWRTYLNIPEGEEG